jgi:hypothetical protein
MQVTFHPLPILSRIAAVFVIAVPLACLRAALDDYEREIIGKMNHRELIAFVEQAHVSSFLSAYFLALVEILIFIAAVESVAFGFRVVFNSFAARRPARVGDEDWLPAR